MAQKHQQKVRRYRISANYRDYFTSNMSLLLKAAVPIQEALTSLQTTSKSSVFHKALDQMKRDIDDGMPLGRAMERAGVASSQTLSLVHIGEESGRLVENLQIAARQEQKQRFFHAKVRSAMMYPAFVLGLTLIVGIAVAWFLLPKLAETFAQLNADMPFISKIFINLGIFLKDNGIWAVPGFLSALFLLFFLLFGFSKTRHLGHGLILHTPGVSSLLREIEIARFGYLLGTLLTAGLPVTQSLNSLEAATTIRSYKKLYRYLSQSFNEGYSFQEALKKYPRAAKLIPPPVQQMIIAGERSGSLPESLLNIGEIYEEKADISTQNLEAILEPILLIIVWLGVLGVAVAVILPIYSLVGGLGV